MTDRTVTPTMVEEAAARALEQGVDLKRSTVHYAAQHLVVYDSECQGSDYTSAVAAVQLWQRGMA